jgi:aspartate dehydrogenase
MRLTRGLSSVKIAFLGLGAIGEAALRRLSTEPSVRVVGALVAHPERSRACASFASLDALLESAPDLVVECARQHVLESFAARILSSGRSMVISSVGALATEETHDALKAAAEAGGAQLFVPAGALAGVDALAAARYAGLQSVLYTRRAPPSTWAKSGAMTESDARRLERAHVVFEGSARDAARRYPKNANVAATVALAGIGFDATRVRLLADPAAKSNVHAIEAEGAFGRLSTEISATPIEGSTSSAIVAGSLARAVLSHIDRIAV